MLQAEEGIDASTSLVCSWVNKRLWQNVPAEAVVVQS